VDNAPTRGLPAKSKQLYREGYQTAGCHLVLIVEEELEGWAKQVKD
jgi:hypothetical protein